MERRMRLSTIGPAFRTITQKNMWKLRAYVLLHLKKRFEKESMSEKTSCL